MHKVIDALTVILFLGGDVMTGRGIDQILLQPSAPALHEPYILDARDYVGLAEKVHGPLPRRADPSYVWGDALQLLDQYGPDVRIVNLETAITTKDDYWLGKGINYRMHPENISVLAASRIHIAALANNHVMDWGYGGLSDTIGSLDRAGILHPGAGKDDAQAAGFAVLNLGEKGRVLVLSAAHDSSGVPQKWAAGPNKAGINLLPDLSDRTVERIATAVQKVKQPNDVIILSIHWGTNWGYDVPKEHVRFSHRVIDGAGVDIVFGHSSHHPRPIEVYHGKLILYGCGDLLNDYEGIGGYEDYRPGLSLLYFATIEPRGGRLLRLEMTPMQIRRFQLSRAKASDAQWLADLLRRLGKNFGTAGDLTPEQKILLRWRE
jgi:poly-gamma-glutamate capsule biosynthesis protein CapA/YwtB (metallophosphatase superfamily)